MDSPNIKLNEMNVNIKDGIQKYTFKRRWKECYKTRLRRMSKSKQSLEETNEALETTNATLKKANEKYKQKRKDNKASVKQLGKEKSSVQQDYDDLQVKYNQKRATNLQQAEEIEKLRTELQQAKIMGDPQKLKDLQTEHHSALN